MDWNMVAYNAIVVFFWLVFSYFVYSDELQEALLTLIVIIAWKVKGKYD
jgi:hypothetical protein